MYLYHIQNLLLKMRKEKKETIHQGDEEKAEIMDIYNEEQLEEML